MKNWLPILLSALLSLSISPYPCKAESEQPAEAQPIEDKDFVTGRQLFWSGRYQQAEKYFLSYLTKNPDHEPTKTFLQMIHEGQNFDPERQQLVQKALEEVRFKQLNWKEVTLDTAINYLREETKKQIPGGEKINFINLLPKDSETKKISLTVENSTLEQVVKQISAQTGVHHRVESDGIVFESVPRSI